MKYCSAFTLTPSHDHRSASLKPRSCLEAFFAGCPSVSYPQCTMAAKHYESSMDSVESPSSSFLCFPRRSIRPAPKEPSTKDLRRRDRDASGIYHFGPVSGPEGSSSSGPKELPAATIRRNSTRTGRIVKEGHDYLRNASDLVFQHRKSLGPQVHDFDSRWAE